MKNKQWQELRSLTEGELEHQLGLRKKKYFELGIQHRFAPVKNPLELRKLRREIAQIKTLFKINYKKEL